MAMRYLVMVVVVSVLAPSAAYGQVDWLVFEDTQSTSRCGVVNAFNSELVVLADTADTADAGKLMIVSGSDLVLSETRVDNQLQVTFGGQPAGVLDFADDGDGFRTLWWLTLDGQVVDIDPFTAEPGVSGKFPEELRNASCDACELVDAPFAGVCDDVVNPGDVGDVLAPIILNLCGINTPAALAMSLLGLGGLRFARRRE